ncbi:hypothetical protein BH11GEM2_BH11GEM2_21820 [soil metagenome]
MAHAIAARDLGSLSKHDRDIAVGALANEAIAPVNGHAMVIKAKIQGYETRYEISSSQLMERLRSNPSAETADIAHWLFWIRLRDLSAGK